MLTSLSGMRILTHFNQKNNSNSITCYSCIKVLHYFPNYSVKDNVPHLNNNKILAK